ncbi:MAG: MFS transporter [Candidatus Marinimicrobia bacterium]|jgi:GPH family glycoside/pentoside/hexuronide:cation symporter|nr:MFS transporter [Candidatus Neomarinimicrobiota bacterium]MCK9558832.1 MFS transporter [Candidatus Neomarinimicrobiota bacterium]
MTEKTGVLNLKEKIGFSLGDTASNLFFQTFIFFLLYFYTDVFGIPASSVATIFLVGRIWDAVNDPLMGALADRTNTKMGKFRPYLLYTALPFGILGFIMFITPDFSVQGKVIYAFVTYNLMMMVYTVINVPYAALMGVISPNSQERTVVSTFRFVAAFIGQFIVQFAVLKLVAVFGKGNENVGWQWTMALISALSVVLWITTFATTRERVKPVKQEKNSFKYDLADLVRNKPWVLIGLATIFQLLFNVIKGGSIVYYFKYFVQDQELTFFGKTSTYSYQALTPVFMLVGTAMTIVGSLVTSFFSKRFGKARSYYGCLGISTIFTLLFFVLKPQDVVWMFTFQIIASFAVGPFSVLQWAIYTDTADYSEWKTGRRATGLIMAVSLFALKLGIALGGAILAWILAIYGFEPNVAQSARSLMGIRLVMSIYPSIAGTIGVLLMVFYPLNNKMMAKIEEDLAARRQNKGAE